MSIPHRCPICRGEGVIVRPNPYGRSAGSPPPAPDTCRACSGKGIVWEPSGLGWPREVEQTTLVRPHAVCVRVAGHPILVVADDSMLAGEFVSIPKRVTFDWQRFRNRCPR